MQAQMSSVPAVLDDPSEPQGSFIRIARRNGCNEIIDCGSRRTIAPIDVGLPEDGKVDKATSDIISAMEKKSIIYEESNNVGSVTLIGVEEKISAFRLTVGRTSAPTRSERQTVPQAMLDAGKDAQRINKERDELRARQASEQRAHEEAMMKMRLELARIQAGQVSATSASNGAIPAYAQQQLSAQQAPVHRPNKLPWTSDLEEEDC